MGFDRGTQTELIFAVKEGMPSEAVINAIASTEGCDQTDLSPLYETLDPEALDSLVTEGKCELVRFTYAGYRVTIRENAEIILEDLD